MAKNDKVLLDGIIDDRVELGLPSDKRDEVFEYLVFEQILKDFDLSKDEIESGWIDGRKDGGIDGFFIFVNGHFLQEPESFSWPRTGSELHVVIITCKHHDAFKQATLDNLAASLTELLDFGVDDSDLKGAYSEAIIKCRNNLKFAYRKLSSKMSKFTIDIYYASRGDTTSIGEEVQSRAKQIQMIAQDCFSTGLSKFEFYGSTELVELHRKMPNYSLELPFVEALSKGERYVLLAKLKDYFHFISDEGKLRRYLFDSNVRDFMGLNQVNEDIKETLDNKHSPDFWWLNNGVTMLATSASVVGKSIQIQDIQIVNGLQTTESIFRHFKNGASDSDDRSVLVKIIVTKDEEVRDSIIRATNNQTKVELNSLHATDKIQRDIEDILLRNGLYYERRKNYYLNLGYPQNEIIAPLSIASGYISLFLKLPHRASNVSSHFIRYPEAYERIFPASAPIEIWPKIAIVLKKTDEFLKQVRPKDGKSSKKFLKRWRNIICFWTVARLIGQFDFSHEDFIAFDTNKFEEGQIRQSWDFINSFTKNNVNKNIWTSKHNIIALCKAGEKELGISGSLRIEKASDLVFKPPNTTIVSMDFALKVKELLPPQPWKPGAHKSVLKSLNCNLKEYDSAIELLINEGLLNRQIDGVVFDSDGSVLSFDPDRVNPKSMKLHKYIKLNEE